jgi:hypothetical protein
MEDGAAPLLSWFQHTFEAKRLLLFRAAVIELSPLDEQKAIAGKQPLFRGAYGCQFLTPGVAGVAVLSEYQLRSLEPL